MFNTQRCVMLDSDWPVALSKGVFLNNHNPHPRIKWHQQDNFFYTVTLLNSQVLSNDNVKLWWVISIYVSSPHPHFCCKIQRQENPWTLRGFRTTNLYILPTPDTPLWFYLISQANIAIQANCRKVNTLTSFGIKNIETLWIICLHGLQYVV